AEYASTVAIAGDVNGDGYDDVLVGAPSYDGGQNYEGRVFLYEGSSSGPSTTADWSVESNASGATFGLALAAAGDVNDDGYDDVIIGAPGYSDGAGLAVVYYGASQGFNLIADWYV